MLAIESPLPQFFDLTGAPLQSGYLYFGTAGQNPQTNPVTAYWDAAGTQPAAQPLRTLNGYIVRNGAPVPLFINGAYSLTVLDKRGKLVVYEPDSSVLTNSQILLDAVSAVQADLANTSDVTKGDALVGVKLNATGTVGRTQHSKNAERVSVIDFGADPTGVADSTTAIQAARDYVASTKAQLIFPAGTYKYSVSPNWAIDGAEIRAEGKVVLNYTGTGNCLIFDAGASAFCYNVKFRGPFVVAGTSTAQNGVYVRSVHHSEIEARVAGCGPTYAGLRTEFAVCTDFYITVSGTEPTPGFISGARPKNGMYLSSRNPPQQTSACRFINPIVEGVSGDGIVLDSAIMCSFEGGTSEANAGLGVSVLSTTSLINTFNKLDLEGNAGGDVKDAGNGNIYNGLLSSSTFTLDTGSINCSVRGGTFNNIVNKGVGNKLEDVIFSNNGGSFTNTGTSTVISKVYNVTTGRYIDDVSAGAVGPVLMTVVNNVATTILTLPTTTNAFYQVYAFLPGQADPANYAAYAVIANDYGVLRIMSSVSGARLVLSVSGLNVKVLQTSGIDQPVACTANKI